jgi:bacillithiol biosynthesis cysteine-adding enzyme BshC
LDVLSCSAGVNQFYPNSISSVSDLAKFIPTVLESFQADRGLLADMLSEFNRHVGSGERTLQKIELLRSVDTVAVVTGQQAGLFTGPAYTVFKAVSAINIAAELSRTGIKAVPVFWVASEDHDLDEAAHTYVLSENGLGEVSYRPGNVILDTPVGSVRLDNGISAAIDAMFAIMPKTAFSDQLRELVTACWQPGHRWSDCFSSTMARLFTEYGLVMLDPMLPELRGIAADGFAAAIDNADAINAALIERSSQLKAAGYHAQVLVEDDHFPMFYIDEVGSRRALRLFRGGFRVKGSGREFSREELLQMARNSPWSLSPGVLLRPVIQDMILPTAAYIGGAAEVAYFAQSSVVCEALGRPVTPVLPRHTATLISNRAFRAMDKLGMSFTDIIDGNSGIILTAAERENPDIVRAFDEAEDSIKAQLDLLHGVAEAIGRPVADSFMKRGRKIAYHIDAMRRLALKTKLENDEVAKRRVATLGNELTPRGRLQERSINIFSFLNEFGPRIIDDLIREFAVDERRHLLLKP